MLLPSLAPSGLLAELLKRLKNSQAIAIGVKKKSDLPRTRKSPTLVIIAKVTVRTRTIDLIVLLDCGPGGSFDISVDSDGLSLYFSMGAIPFDWVLVAEWMQSDIIFFKCKRRMRQILDVMVALSMGRWNITGQLSVNSRTVTGTVQRSSWDLETRLTPRSPLLKRISFKKNVLLGSEKILQIIGK